MDKFEKITRNIFVVLVLLVVFVLGAKNIMQFIDSARVTNAQYKSEGNKNTKAMLAQVEDNYREQFWHKNDMVDIYGVYQKALQRHMIGNFEYVADKNGVLHKVNFNEKPNVQGFVHEVKELKTVAEEKGIPMLYVQAPNRAMTSGDELAADFTNNKEVEDCMVNEFGAAGINVLDLRYKILEDKLDFDVSNTYLHTDLHMGTDAEIWSANEVAKYLDEEMNVPLDNIEYLSDKSLYNMNSYRMLGNYGRTNGSKYLPEDIFDVYHPTTETSFNYYEPGKEDTFITGNFDEVILNGYENSEANLDSPYIYWVTDYMHFTVPYYRYENNNCPDGKKLLIVTDSIAYRSMSYMMMCCNRITILDPRFFGGEDYLAKALEDEYDAVIVWQGTFLVSSEYIVK